MTQVRRVDPVWGVGCPAVESSQFCAGHPGSTGSTRVCRVDPIRRIIPGRAGQPGSGGLSWPQSGMNQPLVHPGSAWVDPGWVGDPGSTGLSRSPGQPGFGLVYPEPVGSSHANPVFFSVHLTRPTRVNPTNPGQPGKTRSDPFCSRLLSRRRCKITYTLRDSMLALEFSMRYVRSYDDVSRGTRTRAGIMRCT